MRAKEGSDRETGNKGFERGLQRRGRFSRTPSRSMSYDSRTAAAAAPCSYPRKCSFSTVKANHFGFVEGGVLLRARRSVSFESIVHELQPKVHFGAKMITLSDML